MKKVNLSTAQGMKPIDVVAAINTGIQIVDTIAPVAKVLFDKINEFLKSLNLGKNNPNSPKNVRLRLEALEAKDKLQKELNKLTEARLVALEAQ